MQARHGFMRIELLVVIVILIGLLLRAVQKCARLSLTPETKTTFTSRLAIPGPVGKPKARH